MEWDGEITVFADGAQARCLIDGCLWCEAIHGRPHKQTVAFVRELLTTHRFYNHKDRKKRAQVNLVLADGVTA